MTSDSLDAMNYFYVYLHVDNRSLAYAAPTLWNGLPKDLRQFAHPPNPPLNFTYPPLALSFPTFHSRLKTELFKIRFHSCTITRRCFDENNPFLTEIDAGSIEKILSRPK